MTYDRKAALEHVLKRVSEARASVASKSTDLAGKRAAYELSVADAKSDLSSAVTELDALEKQARELVLNIYNDTGEKKPLPGVEVKVFEEEAISYDPEKALAWAELRGICLMLDKKKFEKVAVALELPFVDVIKNVEPRAQLSKKL